MDGRASANTPAKQVGGGEVEPRTLRATAGRVGYGHSIGVLMLDCNIPFIPGDVGNASTFDFPVLHRLVPGATAAAVVERQDEDLTEAFVREAVALERQGVRAVTGDCGYMGAFQGPVSEALSIPVFMSTLMQASLLASMLGSQRRLAVIVANSASVSPRLLDSVGLSQPVSKRCVFQGLEHTEAFRGTFLGESGELEPRAVEREVVETSLELVSREPDIGAFLFECSDLPPYAAAVQRETGLPVFDWIGFINYVHHAVVSPGYSGFF